MSPKVLTLDIETSPNIVYRWSMFDRSPVSLEQLIEPSRMLSFSAKFLDEKEIVYMDVRDDLMVDAIHMMLGLADVVVHFNGASFDMPRINAEFFKLGLKAPSPYRQVDLYQAARRQFGFPSSKLDYLLGVAGLGHKVKHEGFGLWKSCLAGDERAWARMRRYNIGDTVKTEKLYLRMLSDGWIPNHPNASLYVDDDTPRCPACSTERIKRDGLATTSLGVYQRYECRNGHYSRGRKAVKYAGLRSAK